MHDTWATCEYLLQPFFQEAETPSVFRQIAVKNFDGSQFETKQVFYTSKDGTKIPMFIIHRKGLKLDGSSPTFLYGMLSRSRFCLVIIFNRPFSVRFLSSSSVFVSLSNTGYGGFSISITPSFSVSRAVFLQHFGGIYAVANKDCKNERI